MVVLASKRLREEHSRVSALLPDFGREVEAPHLLTYCDVLDAHFCIADFFVQEDYGIGGIGPREIATFVSTVERQWTGFGGFTVYETEYERIASLMYGIIKNHPFYDANKRSAFLCALLQLHRMGRTISVSQKEFEDLMVSVADNTVMRRAALKEFSRKKLSHPEIRYLGRYLERNSRKTARLTKTIKFRQLRQMINRYGFDFENQFKGTIDVVKSERKTVHRFWRGDKVVTEKLKVGTIAYHGEGVDVPDSTLKRVRQLCGLTDEDGFDSDVLLRDAQPTFQLIKSYRDSLQRLAFR
ncbi:MAG: type II toxin-antitoxin system death-on-curing family toxin [Pseudomonadota bacterium]